MEYVHMICVVVVVVILFYLYFLHACMHIIIHTWYFCIVSLHIILTHEKARVRVQDLCESRGGRPGPGSGSNGSYGFCGRKTTLNHAYALVTVCPCSGKGVGWGGEGQIILIKIGRR